MHDCWKNNRNSGLEKKWGVMRKQISREAGEPDCNLGSDARLGPERQFRIIKGTDVFDNSKSESGSSRFAGA